MKKGIIMGLIIVLLIAPIGLGVGQHNAEEIYGYLYPSMIYQLNYLTSQQVTTNRVCLSGTCRTTWPVDTTLNEAQVDTFVSNNGYLTSPLDVTGDGQIDGDLYVTGSGGLTKIIGLYDDGSRQEIARVGKINFGVGNQITTITDITGNQYEVVASGETLCDGSTSTTNTLLRNGNPLDDCSSVTPVCAAGTKTSGCYASDMSTPTKNPPACSGSNGCSVDSPSGTIINCVNAGSSSCKNDPAGIWECTITPCVNTAPNVVLDGYYKGVSIQ